MSTRQTKELEKMTGLYLIDKLVAASVAEPFDPIIYGEVYKEVLTRLQELEIRKRVEEMREGGATK